MKIENNILFKSKLELKVDLLMVFISTSVVLLISYFNESLDLSLIIVLSIGIFYVYIIQTKLFFLTEESFVVKYPFLGFLIKPRNFPLASVQKFYFGSNNSPYDPEVFKIYNKKGKRVKYYFSGYPELQELIDLLRAQGFEVEVNSHWWK